MTISTTKSLLAILVLGGVMVANTASAQDSPHWSKESCNTCHVESAPVGGAVNLKAPDAEATCDTCHGDRGDAISCRHASGLPEGNVNLPDNYRSALRGGKVVCSTCHDVIYQCEHPTKPYSFMNPGFLRDRKSQDTSEYCFECHEKSDRAALNPHQGTFGTPARPTCLLCHESLPESNESGELSITFNMTHDLNDVCRGCHNVRPHPGNAFSGKAIGWEHLAVPPENILTNMQETAAETGIVLPLNPFNGEVHCATCHNPHDFKVGGEHGSQESGMEHRLRQDNICQACHDK